MNISPNFIDNKAIDKVVVSNKVCPGKKDFKYFVDYKDAKKVRPFCIFLPKMNARRRDSDKIKRMYSFIKD